MAHSFPEHKEQNSAPSRARLRGAQPPRVKKRLLDSTDTDINRLVGAAGRPRALPGSLKIGVVYKSMITHIVHGIVQKETIRDLGGAGRGRGWGRGGAIRQLATGRGRGGGGQGATPPAQDGARTPGQGADGKPKHSKGIIPHPLWKSPPYRGGRCLLFRLYSAAVLALFRCYSPAIPLLFPCYSPAIRLLFACYSPAILLLFPCYSGFIPALFFYARALCVWGVVPYETPAVVSAVSA